MTAPSENSGRKLAVNRKALHDYHVLDRHEAGIELRGTEVKSARSGSLGLAGSFARIEKGSLILRGLNIPLYEHGSHFNHEPERPRRLLLHRREIDKLRGLVEQKGHTLVPLSLYLKRGMIKVELAVCKGKQQRDKRDTLRKKTADREAARVVAAARRR
jgi:SsrA-binding protein